MAAPDYRAQRVATRQKFVQEVEKSNLRNLVPSRLIASQTPGKARSKSLRKLIEAQRVLPAIRSPEGRVTRGLPGETHYDVIQREARRRGIDTNKFEKVDDLIDEYFKPKAGGAPGEFDEGTGFSETRGGRYLTREEAAKKMGTKFGEAMQIHKAQAQRPLAERLAETRRGAVPEEAVRLLEKRKQTGRILSKLNEGISHAAANSPRMAALLNRRGLVRSIARKSRYLGVALAAGEAIKSYMDNQGE